MRSRTLSLYISSACGPIPDHFLSCEYGDLVLAVTELTQDLCAVLAEDRRRMVVSVRGRGLAHTTAAMRVLETASPPTFYLPYADVVMDELVAIPGTSSCEWKGAARYFTLRDGDGSPVAFHYPNPLHALIEFGAKIAG